MIVKDCGVHLCFFLAHGSMFNQVLLVFRVRTSIEHTHNITYTHIYVYYICMYIHIHMYIKCTLIVALVASFCSSWGVEEAAAG